MAGRRAKTGGTGLILMLIGVVLGSFIGEMTKNVDGLSWLSYGRSFGLGAASPVVLDLAVLRVQFGIGFTLNIAMILGMAVAFYAWRKWF
ncbi:MAG TPA: DUF4321 domain-containing protein [Candidatus Acidoferrum sp.]|nr:DUF4321 domain-containing protein [Candidatus Acidoferrum sp.]